MPTIRIGVIGCGGITGTHLKAVTALAGKLDCRATAFCDINIDAAKGRRKYFGAGDELVTTDYLELLDRDLVDAVLVATPHPLHPEAVIAAFERGIHVVCEKPVAVAVGDAARMNSACEASGCVYTVHFQRRHSPRWRWIKRQIDAGLLGRLLKVDVKWTDSYRPQKYYDSGAWRGKWKTEGGGVLMNQCPHDLDVFAWLLGLPRDVEAKVWLGRFHDTEVEDEVSARLVFDGGGIGHLSCSTCDAPGVNRWDVLGEEGALFVDGDNVRVLRRGENFTRYTKTTDRVWEPVPVEEIAVDLSGETYPTGTEGVWANFLRAIRGEEETFMDGRDGILSLELANALMASGFLGKPVRLPLEPAEYDHVLAQLRSGNTGRAIVRPRAS